MLCFIVFIFSSKKTAGNGKLLKIKMARWEDGSRGSKRGGGEEEEKTATNQRPNTAERLVALWPYSQPSGSRSTTDSWTGQLLVQCFQQRFLFRSSFLQKSNTTSGQHSFCFRELDQFYREMLLLLSFFYRITQNVSSENSGYLQSEWLYHLRSA